MAEIETEASGVAKKWSEGAAWKGGVAPGAKDKAIFTAGAPNIEVTALTKALAIDLTNYKAKLQIKKTLQIAVESEAAQVAVKLGTEANIECLEAAKLEIAGTKAGNQPEWEDLGGGGTRSIELSIKGTGVKFKLKSLLKITTGTLEVLRCADFITENNTIEVPRFEAPGETSSTFHMAKSLIKITASALQWGEGITPNASEATIEGVANMKVEVNHNHTLGTVIAKKEINLSHLGAAPKELTIGTLKLDNGGNALETERTCVFQTEAATVFKYNLTTWTTNASSEAKRVVIKSSVAGKPAAVKKAAGKVELDYIEVKDNTAEGEIPFKALSHSVLGEGNTNWELVTEGVTTVAGTSKIKVQGVANLAQTFSAEGTTKVRVKATTAIVQTLSVAGSSKIRLKASGTSVQNVTLAGASKVTFGAAANIKVTHEGEGRKAIIMIFED